MLVVIAEKEELKLVEELGYSNYPVLITGVGAINVIQSLKNIPISEEIVNIGYCGSNNIAIGTKCKIGQCFLYHPNVNYGEIFEGAFKQSEFNGNYTCYTSTDFVTHTDIKEPCVFDMELAFILALGYRNIQAIKVVSDNLNKKEYKENSSIEN